MTLHIAYCGGCNPEFDRVQFARQVAQLAGAQPAHGRPGEDAVCLCVSGCRRSCALRTGGRTVHVCSGQNVQDTALAVQAALEKAPAQAFGKE